MYVEVETTLPLLIYLPPLHTRCVTWKRKEILQAIPLNLSCSSCRSCAASVILGEGCVCR